MGTMRGLIFIEEGGSEIAKFHAPKTARVVLDALGRNGGKLLDPDGFQLIGSDSLGAGRYIFEHIDVPSTRAPAEGVLPSNRSREDYQFWDAVALERFKVATARYYEKLLEAPPELPISTAELRKFLSATTERLPLSETTYSITQHPDLVKPCTSKAEEQLAAFLYSAFSVISTPLENEASSSSALAFLTGQFIMHLNDFAPVSKQLRGLRCILDSANPGTSTSATLALLPLLRPDYQVFVDGVLMLRWENKIVTEEISDAKEENRTKLGVWSPLYYGKLPYVIGGCCGGKIFRWLKLSPNGKEIVAEYISDSYDLSMPSGVALFLHSVIRMHCLLKKLQEELDGHIPVKLYAIERRPGGEVSIYPAFVQKLVMF